MKLYCRNSRRALTLIEVLVVVVVVLLASLLLPIKQKLRSQVQRETCIHNLKQVETAFLQQPIMADFITLSQTNLDLTLKRTDSCEAFRRFRELARYLNCSTKILVCPADKSRKPAKNFESLLSNTNISYFAGLDADHRYSDRFVAGDHNLTNGTLLLNLHFTMRAGKPHLLMRRFGRWLPVYRALDNVPHLPKPPRRAGNPTATPRDRYLRFRFTVTEFHLLIRHT